MANAGFWAGRRLESHSCSEYTADELVGSTDMLFCHRVWVKSVITAKIGECLSCCQVGF
jgi:hypothetical protein